MLLSISDWWNSLDLSTAGLVFICLALPATLLLLIQTIMMFVGMGGNSDISGDSTADGIDGDFSESDGDVVDAPDSDDIADAAGLEGLRILTVRGIVAFFVVFGWVGLAMDQASISLFITLPVAFICGFATMLLLAFLFKSVMKLRNDGNINNRNAIGVSGRVHLTVPASRSGDGKVHVMIQGTYVERNAVTDDEEAIPTGSEIVVIGVSGETDLIVKRK